MIKVRIRSYGFLRSFKEDFRIFLASSGISNQEIRFFNHYLTSPNLKLHIICIFENTKEPATLDSTHDPLFYQIMLYYNYYTLKIWINNFFVRMSENDPIKNLYTLYAALFGDITVLYLFMFYLYMISYK